MHQVKDARPLSLAATGRAANTATVSSGHHGYYSTLAAPVALEVYKRGRWCIVAKVTNLDGEQILAIAHRGQRGVESTISLPLAALDYAERAGCQCLYFRRDTTGQMWRLPLADLRRVGWLAPSDGIAEMFVKIERMHKVPWRKWEYAEQTARVGQNDHTSEHQLDLFGEVAV